MHFNIRNPAGPTGKTNTSKKEKTGQNYAPGSVGDIGLGHGAKMMNLWELKYICSPNLFQYFFMYRTHHCGELNSQFVNQNVTLAGWVQTIRKFGAITFVDIRDRYGITQLLIGEELQSELDKNPLGREFVIQVKGTVIERSSKNANIPTGDIEIKVTEFKILNASAVPPFTIQDDTDGGDDIRMKYRFLDLRRNAVKKNLTIRYNVNRATRNYLHEKGFMDIETPFLIKSTPEGARDFVVPSRMNAGEFYALPQ